MVSTRAQTCAARSADLYERVEGLDAGEGADHINLEHSPEVSNASARAWALRKNGNAAGLLSCADLTCMLRDWYVMSQGVGSVRNGLLPGTGSIRTFSALLRIWINIQQVKTRGNERAVRAQPAHMSSEGATCTSLTPALTMR